MQRFIIKRITNNNGFTLVEVSIIVIIIGVMVTLVLPDFNKTIGRYNLDNSARLLVSDIRSLQQSAIKNESPDFNILFNTVNERYYLRNGITVYKTVNLPSSVDLVFSNFTDNKLICAANGRPYGGIGGTVRLQDRKTGKFLYVIIDTVGRVRVSETSP